MGQDANPLFPGKYFISTVLETLETKHLMSGELARRYLQRAAMAGIVIGLLYATNYAIVASLGSIEGMNGSTFTPLGKYIGALSFGFALVFIYYSKSELLTSNMMIVTIGAYYKSTGWVKVLRILGLCYFGNLLGGIFMAVLIKYSTVLDGAPMEEMQASVDHKLEYITEGAAGWGDLFIRAILCNFMINLAMLLVYNGLIKEDLMKSVVMIMSVFVFAFLGFEHSVANTVLFAIVGMKEGIDAGLAAANLGIALLGNYVGGGVLIGLYYAYVNDDAKYLRSRGEAQ